MSGIAELSAKFLSPPRYAGAPFRLPPTTAALCQAVRFGIVGMLAWKAYVEASFALNREAVAASVWKFPAVSVYGVDDLQLWLLLILNLTLIVGLQAGIYGSLFQLFTGFLRGEVFSRASGVWLRRAGLFDLAFVVAGPLRATLAVALLTAQLPGGAHWEFQLLGMAPLYDFVLGSVGFVLGQVFIAAAEMADDHAQIV